MKTIAFFNNKGGVGKTSLVYHLGWMFADRGVKTLVVDLDPQANLTTMFLDEDALEAIWSEDEHPDTVYGAVLPLLHGTGDIARPKVQMATPNLGLIAGDLRLLDFEDELSGAWSSCQNRDESAFRTMTAFYRLIHEGASWGAEVVLVDIGSSLGAINRAALIASDQVVFPLAPYLSSLYGLTGMGMRLRDWRQVWSEIAPAAPPNLAVPEGLMQPIGYVLIQRGIRNGRSDTAYQRWVDRIPGVYRNSVLEERLGTPHLMADDPNCLAQLKYYGSLMPLAMEANKPMFFLKAADGAIGAHVEAVKTCYEDFLRLAKRIADHAGIDVASR